MAGGRLGSMRSEDKAASGDALTIGLVLLVMRETRRDTRQQPAGAFTL